ncbi:hypothetical protein [Desulforamulus ruminis]|uniref:Uncharacterized protein n=1 Tax=Desulforamulus ruminis (strain ATCC 23193 / DSM 2154 / NCIMB 8452 / DL) TaxID=696281 RepID=F6DT12_DESRL|nr:hypothetical protein [Desulforamulus ruminis]AEG60006.1 hypothetical protein Desru_1742 [Desulforamulus ruminis DSM 2154]
MIVAQLTDDMICHTVAVVIDDVQISDYVIAVEENDLLLIGKRYDPQINKFLDAEQQT